MRTHLVGFELNHGNGVSLEEFFDHIASLHEKTIPFGSYGRLTYIAEKDDYYLGLFLTIKDQTKLLELRKEHGGYEIAVRSLAENTSVIDFNFFILHQETAKGLYSHYHHSCSINQFGLFLRRQYDELRIKKRNAEIEALVNPKEKDKKAVAKRYARKPLTLTVMVRKEKLPALLGDIDRILSFEYDMHTLSAEEPDNEPIKPFVKKETHRIRFVRNGSKGVIANWITNRIKNKELTDGRVSGLDEDGQTQAFRLMNNPDSFGQFEYDEIADETMLTTKEFQSSPFFAEMLKAAKTYRALFELKSER